VTAPPRPPEDDLQNDPAPDRFQPYYPTVAAFVELEFAPVFARRSTPTFRWCAQWWRHPEAIHRFTELWYSWETLRLNPPLGMGTWYEHHLDRHLPILTANDGPFAGCSPTEHYSPDPQTLPTRPPPPGWFPPPQQPPTDPTESDI
jgi:hypothetical protein